METQTAPAVVKMPQPLTAEPLVVKPNAAPSPPQFVVAGSPEDIAFFNAYWAHQPPAVRALQGQTDSAARQDLAEDLATHGYTIDGPIMVWGMDPLICMQLRQYYGYTWVNNALQNVISIVPGLNYPTGTPYNPDAPPAGSILVSTNIADYPPYSPGPGPQPGPPAPAGKDPVGAQVVGNIYLTIPGDLTPVGASYTDARGTFVKMQVGANVWWQKQ
jgi:hypothetical protein